MFDPTIFDNLKVVIEGAIYDLDLTGEISVTGRSDMVDLATLKREYRIRLKRDTNESLEAGITLIMDLANLSSEMLNLKGDKPGCELNIEFQTKVYDGDKTCETIKNELLLIWGEERDIKQSISYIYGETNKRQEFSNSISVGFNRLVGEEQIDDLLEMIPYILTSLDVICTINSKK